MFSFWKPGIWTYSLTCTSWKEKKKLWSLSLSLDFSLQTALPKTEQSMSYVTRSLETYSWSPLDLVPWAFAFTEFALTLHCNSSWLWGQLCISLLSSAYKSAKLRMVLESRNKDSSLRNMQIPKSLSSSMVLNLKSYAANILLAPHSLWGHN